VVARARAFACTGACGFAMRDRVAGRAITAALAGVLLERRRSQPLRGFRSKAGKPFAAALVLGDDGELRFDFGGADRARSPGGAEPAAPRDPPPCDPPPCDPPPRDPPPRARRRKRPSPEPAGVDHDALGCPRCHQGTLITGARGWGCSRWRDGCRFVIWFETAGRRLSAAQLRDLITRGKTRKARFVSDRGVERDGRLVLDPAADGGSAHFEPA
jgi:DNA topoisomerase-3